MCLVLSSARIFRIKSFKVMILWGYIRHLSHEIQRYLLNMTQSSIFKRSKVYMGKPSSDLKLNLRNHVSADNARWIPPSLKDRSVQNSRAPVPYPRLASVWLWHPGNGLWFRIIIWPLIRLQWLHMFPNSAASPSVRLSNCALPWFAHLHLPHSADTGTEQRRGFLPFLGLTPLPLQTLALPFPLA